MNEQHFIDMRYDNFSLIYSLRAGAESMILYGIHE